MLSVASVFSAVPDTSAFIGGVELVLSIALVVIALLGGVAIFRRIIGA